MNEITIYGAGGHCYAVIELIRSLGAYKIKSIIDDNPSVLKILDIPVIKNTNNISLPNTICVSIGDNRTRKTIVEKLTSNFPMFIHESAVVYPSAKIGIGTTILPQCVIDASVRIGDFCIVNNNSTISHNTLVGNYCHVAINAAIAGGVTIGEGTLIGAGSSILPEVKIGKWVKIGAGAVVVKDIPDFATVIGNPARIIKTS